MMRPTSLLLTSVLLLASCGREGGDPVEANAAPSSGNSESASPAEPAAQYSDELAAVDASIASALSRVEVEPTDWLALGRAVGGYLARARLTGSYDDYARAEELLDRAFEIAPDRSGPVGTRASMNFSLHRLDRVAVDLDALAARPPMLQLEPDEDKQRRGTLALQLGRYDDARRLLQESIDHQRTFSNISSLALYYWQTGDFEAADSLYAQALPEYHGGRAEPVAWLHLQRGLLDLDRGRYDEALAHYRDAEGALAGWYLVDEHIAEIFTLTGRTDEAIPIYEEIVERTGLPEFMDALAGIYADRAEDGPLREYVSRARGEYATQLERFPEAAYGHALDHFLEFSDDPSEAVELASKNHAVRPNGKAKTKLGAAYLAAGRLPEARAILEEALRSPYDSAELRHVAAETYFALELNVLGEEQRQAALAIDPNSFER